MGCNRTGMCCTMFYLSVSPEELKVLAEEYENHPYEYNGVPARIDEMYRMVGDRCIGKLKAGGYLYGPCRNLTYTEDENGKKIAACAIHENKPWTCAGYPYYNEPEINSKYILHKGCGYETPTSKTVTHEEQLEGLEEKHGEEVSNATESN